MENVMRCHRWRSHGFGFLWLLMAMTVTLLLATILLATTAAGAPACRISEFPCKNSRCVRLDRYCDGTDDCGDTSDEPPYCTVCNRTYYGDVGKTYELNLTKPVANRLPFLCHLTFTANGHSHGDIVQLIFDSFRVGRYEETELDGCPDGYMQLSELGRPFTGGSWCGASSGYAVYYSETSTVTVSLKVFRAASGAAPFDFRLRYKFVSQLEAVVRWGSAAAPLERGLVSPGTYCTRQLDECRFKPCRLQSPNYPGMYPRNVTCYWSVHQRDVPTCKHAMIAVRQEAAHKVHMKRSVAAAVAGLNKTGRARALRAWRDCTGERDHLIFYDGPTTNDPVLAKYCGGDWLPQVISHGPWMLVAFHSSPFSVPLHTGAPGSPLRGFELDVDVIFADSDSLDYARESRRCEFLINATSADDVWEARGRRGRLLSPRHTLPPNTTCTYRLRGQPGDLVWLYFVSYSQRPLLSASSSGVMAAAMEGPPPPGYGNGTELGDLLAWQGGLEPSGSRSSGTTGACTTRLRIWDGGGPGSAPGETRIIADHCDGDPPRLCDHTSLSNATRATRPCLAHESYVSTGAGMVLQHYTQDGTALHPANFRLRYEFVDTRLGGEPWHRGHPCSRVFRRVSSGTLRSPRNVFMFGRGGARNLTCVYRLEAAAGEKVRLVLHNVSLGDGAGGGSCITEPDPHTGRPRCSPVTPTTGRTAELRVWEVPWREVRVPRACLCDNYTLTARPLVFLSASRFLEVHLTVTGMNVSEDFRDIYFHGTFEMVHMPECPRKQRLRGSGGAVEWASPPPSRVDLYCEGLPWLVEAHENRSLFLLTWGTFLPVEPNADEPARCVSKNRVLIYSGRPARLVRVVCPAEPNTRQFAVHVFSEEWFATGSGGSDAISSRTIALAPVEDNTSSSSLAPPRPPSFLVECVSREPGVAAFNWLEISRSRSALLQQFRLDNETLAGLNDTGLPSDWECAHRCPELDACISSSLWCDGKQNCPSGFDEAEAQCGAGRRFLRILPGGVYTALSCAAAAAAVLLLLAACAVARKVRARRRRTRLAKKKLIAGEMGGGTIGMGPCPPPHCLGSHHGTLRGPPRRATTEEMLLDPSGCGTLSTAS